MNSTNGRILSLLGGGLALLLLAAVAFYPVSTPDDERAFVSADQVKAAVDAATARQSGQVGGVYVENEGEEEYEEEYEEEEEEEEEEMEEGTAIEVLVRDAGGSLHTVEVNAETGNVVEVEEGREEHHEMGEEEEEYKE